MLDTVEPAGATAAPQPSDAAETAQSLVIERFLCRLVHRGSPCFSRQVALAEKVGSGWSDVTFEQLDTAALALSARLTEAGVAPQDPVAILAEPGISWVVAFFATVFAGAAAVPLDVKLTSEEAGDIVAHARPVAVISSASLRARAVALAAGVGGVCPALLAPDAGMVAALTAAEDTARPRAATAGSRLGQAAVVAYTSGSTGEPKGVLLSFANLKSQVESLAAAHSVSADDVFLSILPSNHMFELTCGLLTALYCGAQVVYCGSLLPEEICGAIAARGVTRMVVVPLFLKLLARRVEAEMRRQVTAKRVALDLIGAVAARLPSRRARRALFGPVVRRIGPELRAFYVGGAPLESGVAERFERMGIGVFQGYGLTEASPVVTMNSPRANRLGSVGRPLAGVEVAIRAVACASTGEGEIVVRGPNVMLGYHHDPAATAEAIDRDGWLRTGDLGHLDADGFLYVSGRAKNLIVLPSGKKVQPEEVEAALERSEWVREACVFPAAGEAGLTRGAEQVHAVVVPCVELLALGLTDEAVISRTLDATRRALASLAGYKHPVRIVVSFDELPKTTSRKVRRSLAAARYAQPVGVERAGSRLAAPGPGVAGLPARQRAVAQGAGSQDAGPPGRRRGMPNTVATEKGADQ
jgi:long-chain acyl-CoA synthetase